MAKKSAQAREAKRIATVKQNATRMANIKQIIKESAENPEEMMRARMKRNKMSRNASPSRVRRRCGQCGRSRGVYRLYGLCRICLREAAMRGDIPGLSKASW